MMETGIPEVSMRKTDKAFYGALLAATTIAVVGGGYGLYLLLPFLITLAENTIYFFVELGVLGFLLLLVAQVLMSRQAIEYKMKMFARNIRKSVIQSDPIGAIDVAIGNFERRLTDVDDKIRDAVAAQKQLASKVDDANSKAVNELNLAQAAQRKALPDSQINVHLLAHERWLKAVEDVQPILTRQNLRQVKLKQARELCDSGLQNLHNQRDILNMKLQVTQADRAQAKAFKRFFGNNADREAIDIAVEDIERQSAQCEAEVEQMMAQAEPMIEATELQKDADLLHAKERLAAAQTKGQLAAGTPDLTPSQALPVKEGVLVGRKS